MPACVSPDFNNGFKVRWSDCPEKFKGGISGLTFGSDCGRQPVVARMLVKFEISFSVSDLFVVIANEGYFGRVLPNLYLHLLRPVLLLPNLFLVINLCCLFYRTQTGADSFCCSTSHHRTNPYWWFRQASCCPYKSVWQSCLFLCTQVACQKRSF